MGNVCSSLGKGLLFVRGKIIKGALTIAVEIGCAEVVSEDRHSHCAQPYAPLYELLNQI